MELNPTIRGMYLVHRRKYQNIYRNIILMDLNMPRMDGISATKKIRQICPNTQIIILTSFVKDENVQTALEAGAIAYILKDATGDDLAIAIRRAHNGKATLSPEATQALVTSTIAPPLLGHDLTNREHDILQLMIEGLSNHKIAERLVINSSTVKNHVSSILGKLDISTRTHAVALAIKNEILK